MKSLVAFALATGIALAAEPAAPTLSTREIQSPAGPNSVGASLVSAPDGTVWLSWVEASTHAGHAAAVPDHHGMPDHHEMTAHHTTAPKSPTAGVKALKYATFDATANKWSAAQTIFSGAGLGASSLDFPQLAVGANGHAVAVWTDGAGGAQFSESVDGGGKWTQPQTWSREGRDMEKFSLVTLADGRILAAWLDGRKKTSNTAMQNLYARVVGQDGPDVLVDDSVCDCCPTTLTAFLDGGAMLAYRGRTTEEIRDIRIARFRDNRWEAPRPLNNDGWRINACPVNGPQLASDGGRVSVAWYTAAENTPQVLATYSPDAGARYMMPLRIDQGKPAGQVDTILLHDSTTLISWLETDGSLWLRRLSPDFAPDDPVALAVADQTGTVKGIPRMALLRDYAGGRSEAQLLVAYTRQAAGATTVHTLHVNVPEAALLEAERNCDCAPAPEQLQGYPIRGTIADVLPDTASLQIRHFEVPGVFAAGVDTFRAEPEALAAVQRGRQFLGRIDRRDGVWHLFDVRLLAPMPAK